MHDAIIHHYAVILRHNSTIVVLCRTYVIVKTYKNNYGFIFIDSGVIIRVWAGTWTNFWGQDRCWRKMVSCNQPFRLLETTLRMSMILWILGFRVWYPNQSVWWWLGFTTPIIKNMTMSDTKPYNPQKQILHRIIKNKKEFNCINHFTSISVSSSTKTIVQVT